MSSLKMKTDINVSSLTPRELEYFLAMNGKLGVPFITSEPGLAKSSILRAIAKKTGMNYIDLRLAMADEGDFKYPYLSDGTVKRKSLDGSITEESVKVSSYAVPKWAYEANERPTIIHFEELNRATLPVMNACLQILLEREIGSFQFNDNVLMVATGNLGDTDGTTVNEFDSALNNRLIHISHTLTVDEWLVWARGKDENGYPNIHHLISDFIESDKGAYMEKAPTEEGKQAYATPRTWHMLSNQFMGNYYYDTTDENIDLAVSTFTEMGDKVVGSKAKMKLVKYMNSVKEFSTKDILNNGKVVANFLKKNPDRKDVSSHILDLVKKILQLSQVKNNTKEFDNLVLVTDQLSPEELFASIMHMIKTSTQLKQKDGKADPETMFFGLMKRYEEQFRKIKQVNMNQNKR